MHFRETMCGLAAVILFFHSFALAQASQAGAEADLTYGRVSLWKDRRGVTWAQAEVKNTGSEAFGGEACGFDTQIELRVSHLDREIWTHRLVAHAATAAPWAVKEKRLFGPFQVVDEEAPTQPIPPGSYPLSVYVSQPSSPIPCAEADFFNNAFRKSFLLR